MNDMQVLEKSLGIQFLPFDVGTMCDDHNEKLAIARLEYSGEILDMCEDCLAVHLEVLQDTLDEEKDCDWCRKPKLGVLPFKDAREGPDAEPDDVCPECRLAHREAINEERSEFDDAE